VRFLLDQNISPKVANVLRPAGHDVTIARDVGLQRASDEVVIATARLDNLDLVADDLDAGAIVVLGEATLRIHRLPVARTPDRPA
jgi:predicted nuclease of predicted toxin-antitoxin system